MANVGTDPEAACQRDCQLEESSRQWVGHLLWKATYGLVGPFKKEIPQGVIVDLAPGTGAWVKEAAAIFHGTQIHGINIHAYDCRSSHSCSCRPTSTLKCECKPAEPPNVNIGDRELNLPFDKNSTAFVNLRDTDLWLCDKDSLFDRIALILRPGGWLQHCETRLSEWKSNKLELNEWRDLVITCARALGCELSSGADVRKSLKERGIGEYQMSQRTWQTFATELNDHVKLFLKHTVKASRPILVEGGFGGPEAVDKLLKDVLLKVEEPDFKATINAHSCWARKRTCTFEPTSKKQSKWSPEEEL